MKNKEMNKLRETLSPYEFESTQKNAVNKRFSFMEYLYSGDYIKVFYKNQEIGTFEMQDISFVAFSGSGGQKVKKGDYPIMNIYGLKGEAFLNMPLSLRNYWLMKKYFLKYNVDIEDAYNL